MKKIPITLIVAGLLVVTSLLVTGAAAAAQTLEERVPSSVTEIPQSRVDPEADASKSEPPSNIVTSKEPEQRSKTDNPPAKKETAHRNPDYDASGNIVLDLGAAINDMEVVENNLVVVSPTADWGKMFFVHIEPGAGLKGVKVTDTFAWIPHSPNPLDRRMYMPCLVDFNKKRFGDSEKTPDASDTQKAPEDGYLRIVIHCTGSTRRKDGTLEQALTFVDAPNPDSSEGANPNMANPVVRVPVSISKKDGRLVAYSDRAEIVSAISPDNTGLFKNKTVTAAGVIGLKRSVKIGKVKVEVDKDKDTCLVISDPAAPPPQ